METGLIDLSSRPGWWVGALAIALFACFVAMTLSRGMLASSRATAARSLASTGLALTSGAWAVHFIVVSATDLLTAWHYHPLQVFGLLVVAWVGTCLGLRVAVTRTPTTSRVVAGASLVAVSLLSVPLLAALSLRVDPVVHWHAHWSWSLVLVVWAGCVAGFLLLIRGVRPSQAMAGVWRGVAAVCVASAIVAGNLVLMGAVSVPALAVTVAGVSVDTLLALAVLAVPSLLSLLLIGSVLESRFKAALRHAREELLVSAQTDALTQLPNRAMFETWSARAAMKADRSGQRLALLFINLDGLKSVNESFGQAAGDALLCEMGQRLRSMAASRDLVARAGGDEFLMLLEGNPSEADASNLANRLLKALNDPCLMDDREVSTTCSVGIAMYPEHGAQSKLIPHAAAAMHAAKRNGGATYCFFEPRMVAGARDQIDLLRDLRRAIQQKELELYYQPKIHAPSGQITGAEALMRWHHPQRGMVGPNIFIPLAEKFGLIQALGNWLIEDVCRQISAWRDGGLRMRVAINLSVHQLRQEDLVQRITDALARNHIAPSLLTCEITESAAMEDTRTTLKVIERLAAAGVHLSIDDFGTGYSSLSYLRQLAAEELKIDRSFVLDLETSADARAIVDAVVKLAQALGLKVVAEGVETEAQQKILRSLGCDELQGFLFAKPMSAKALTLWAIQDEGPRSMEFRPSLFDDTLSNAVL